MRGLTPPERAFLASLATGGPPEDVTEEEEALAELLRDRSLVNLEVCPCGGEYYVLSELGALMLVIDRAA
jgi:hypothetical protein